MTDGVIAAINHMLRSAGWARDRLAAHAGCSAVLRAAPCEVAFTVLPDGFLERSTAAPAPSVTLSLPPSALPQFLGGNADAAMKEARIEGNAEFADTLGFVFRNLRWDAEEDLSRVFGDIAARRFVLGAQAFKSGGSRACAAFGGNLAEYFTDEQRLLVARAALEAHISELGRLRDDIARLDKRTERLLDPADIAPAKRGASSARTTSQRVK